MGRFLSGNCRAITYEGGDNSKEKEIYILGLFYLVTVLNLGIS